MVTWYNKPQRVTYRAQGKTEFIAAHGVEMTEDRAIFFQKPKDTTLDDQVLFTLFTRHLVSLKVEPW